MRQQVHSDDGVKEKARLHVLVLSAAESKKKVLTVLKLQITIAKVEVLIVS